MSRIDELWQRLKDWANTNAPEMLSDLNPGASVDDIKSLEKQLGVTLPDAFKASLAVHNGENDGWPCKVFADYGAYLSCNGIVEEWQQRNHIVRENPDIDRYPSDVIGPMKSVSFHPAWVPFLNCNGDRVWALDMAPTEGGTPGQVIEIDWEGTYQRVIADSFERFFADYVEAIKSGDFEIVDGQPTKEGEDPDRPEPTAGAQALKERRRQRDEALTDLVGTGAVFLIVLAGWMIIRMIWIDVDLRRTSILISTIVTMFILVEAPSMMRKPLTGRAKAMRLLVLPMLLGLYLMVIEGLARLRFLNNDFSLTTMLAVLIYTFGGFAVLWTVFKIFRSGRTATE